HMQAEQALTGLLSPSASVRPATLWHLDEQGPTPNCFEAVMACLKDPDPELPAAAAALMPRFPGREAVAVGALRVLAFSEHAWNRWRSAQALCQLREYRPC